MAIVRLGNFNADMRNTQDYGSTDLRAFLAFADSFQSVSDKTLQQNNSVVSVEEKDASGKTITTTAVGNLPALAVSSLSIAGQTSRSTLAVIFISMAIPAIFTATPPVNRRSMQAAVC